MANFLLRNKRSSARARFDQFKEGQYWYDQSSGRLMLLKSKTTDGRKFFTLKFEILMLCGEWRENHRMSNEFSMEQISQYQFLTSRYCKLSEEQLIELRLKV